MGIIRKQNENRKGSSIDLQFSLPFQPDAQCSGAHPDQTGSRLLPKPLSPAQSKQSFLILSSYFTLKAVPTDANK